MQCINFSATEFFISSVEFSNPLGSQDHNTSSAIVNWVEASPASDQQSNRCLDATMATTITVIHHMHLPPLRLEGTNVCVAN